VRVTLEAHAWLDSSITAATNADEVAIFFIALFPKAQIPRNPKLQTQIHDTSQLNVRTTEVTQ